MGEPYPNVCLCAFWGPILRPLKRLRVLGSAGLSGFGSCSNGVLGGSWDLVSTVISTLSGVISSYKYSYLNYNPSY